MSVRPVAWLAGLALAIAVGGGCETDTSPGDRSATPPPPPSRTPAGLRHAPNSGVQPLAGEMDEAEAAELLGAPPPEAEAPPADETAAPEDEPATE